MDIIIPHALVSDDDLKVKALQLVRGTCLDLNDVEQYYLQLLHCLQYPETAPPIADLLRRLHHLTGSWLVVSPIYWEASHNDAMLLAVGEDLALSDEEGLAWFEVFATFAKEDFAAVHYHDPYTWLIQIDDQPLTNAKPPYRLHHQSMMPELAVLDSTLFWQKRLTEFQMLFSQHPLNQTRKGKKCPINGIWVWGQGVLNPSTHRLIVADSPQNQRLAQVLSTHTAQLSDLDVYPDTALILLEDKNNLLDVQLKTNRQIVNWYWQNCAYQTIPKGWFKRLWSVLC
ncbi:MAG: hypothetical protein CK424_02590 [Legionella sp.]|nr:MAG: hypothetical protein CK424_02590 [Legionella sp.]